MNKRLLQVLYFAIILIIICCFFVFDFNKYFHIENIERVKLYFLEFGNWAPVIMIGLYILLNIAAVPRVFFTIFSGYVFGVFYGFIFAWIATIIGLSVSFLMVRYLFLQSFERKFGNKKLVEKINHRIDKNGIWLVIFLRAIYFFPSTVLNYSFGFTKMKAYKYLLGSAIGFIPVVLVNVWGGNAIFTKTANNAGYVFILVGLLLLVLAYFAQKLILARIT